MGLNRRGCILDSTPLGRRWAQMKPEFSQDEFQLNLISPFQLRKRCLFPKANPRP